MSCSSEYTFAQSHVSFDFEKSKRASETVDNITEASKNSTKYNEIYSEPVQVKRSSLKQSLVDLQQDAPCTSQENQNEEPRKGLNYNFCL